MLLHQIIPMAADQPLHLLRRRRSPLSSPTNNLVFFFSHRRLHNRPGVQPPRDFPEGPLVPGMKSAAVSFLGPAVVFARRPRTRRWWRPHRKIRSRNAMSGTNPVVAGSRTKAVHRAGVLRALAHTPPSVTRPAGASKRRNNLSSPSTGPSCTAPLRNPGEWVYQSPPQLLRIRISNTPGPSGPRKRRKALFANGFWLA